MPWSSVEPYRLKLLGPWDLRGPEDERVSSVLAQPKRLCLLAYLALAQGPVSRSTVVALFWPESDEERARNALSQALFHLRRSLSKDVIESVDGNTRLAVSLERLQCDARDFLESSHDSSLTPSDASVDAARSIVDGADFFEGWNSDDCQALQEWIDGVRRRVREHAAVIVEAANRNGAAAALTAAHGTAPVLAGAEADDDEPGRHIASSRPRLLGLARRYAFPAVVVLLAAAALATVIAWNGDEVDGGPLASVGPPEGGTGPGTASRTDPRPVVAVLMPSITSTDSSMPRQLADAVQGEILAALDGMIGIRTFGVSSEDAGGLERFLSEQFQPRDSTVPFGVSPDWVIKVSLFIAPSRIRAITQFRDGSASHRDWYPEGINYDAPTPGDALIDVPQEIARDVATRFEGWIARERPTPR